MSWGKAIMTSGGAVQVSRVGLVIPVVASRSLLVVVLNRGILILAGAVEILVGWGVIKRTGSVERAVAGFDPGASFSAKQVIESHGFRLIL